MGKKSFSCLKVPVYYLKANTLVSQGESGQGVMLNTQIQQALRLSMSGVILLLHVYAFKDWRRTIFL
jgi:hypothetical protein